MLNYLFLGVPSKVVNFVLLVRTYAVGTRNAIMVDKRNNSNVPNATRNFQCGEFAVHIFGNAIILIWVFWHVQCAINLNLLALVIINLFQ